MVMGMMMMIVMGMMSWKIIFIFFILSFFLFCFAFSLFFSLKSLFVSFLYPLGGKIATADKVTVASRKSP